MAIFSFHLGVISRSSGGKKRKDGSLSKAKIPRSCQVAAAYKRAGKVVVAEQTWNYTRKKDVFPFGVTVPKGCPAIESAVLWSKADAAEKRKDATTAREGHAALPIECSPKEWFFIMNEFASWMSDTHKVAFDLNYHYEPGNPHIDFQFTTREYLLNGTFGAKTRQLDDLKTGPELVEAMRAKWAAICNQYLKKYGTSIDHRSYKRQGLDMIPQIHLGQAAAELEAKGIQTERGDYNRAVQRINKEQKEIMLILQQLRGGSYVSISGVGLQKNIGRMAKEISSNRNDTVRSTHQLPEHLQRRDEYSDLSLGGESARTSAWGAGVLPEATGGTPGGNASSGIYGASGVSSALRKSQQWRTSTLRRDSRTGGTALSSREHSSAYAGTASSIMNLLGEMRQNIMMQVDTANIKMLRSNGRPILLVSKIMKAIQRITTEVKQTADVSNLKIIKEVRHGTQETTKENHRGTRNSAFATHRDS